MKFVFMGFDVRGNNPFSRGLLFTKPSPHKSLWQEFCHTPVPKPEFVGANEMTMFDLDWSK